ncbi:MAG: SusF/SusE family outer membrane protein [Bacteroidota bacterium]
MLKRLLFSLTILTLTASFSFAQIDSVSIIGAATPGGWEADTQMEQDPMNPDLWTISIDLVTDELKFRANNAWDINWGATDFPTGIGEQNGPNIPAAGCPCDVTLNVVTGEYTFVSTAPTYNTIGLIGTGTPNGDFDTDVVMEQDPNVPWVYVIENISLTAGDVKFRADGAWDANWGGEAFPAGTGTMGGANIAVMGGDYKVTFNSATGEYDFELLIPLYESLGIVGSATEGGADMVTALTQNPNQLDEWSANVTLTDGELKFRAEDNTDLEWGNDAMDEFPTGTASLEVADAISVTAGDYSVTFNSTTGEYSFDDPLGIFNSIGIIGTATGLGFDEDIDMYVDPAQPDSWNVSLKFTDGVIKFRADNDWAVNWGDDGFPTGTGVQDGPDIQVFAGDWEVAFNSTTGEYSLTPLSIGILGTATPTGWDADTDLTASTTEGSIWTIAIDLTDGESKFRRDDVWTVNWGAVDFPAGTGTQDGDNIPIVAGSYNVTFNSSTGEYLFSTASGTSNVLSPNTVQLAPNPTSNELNIQVDAEELQRNATIRIFTTTGQLLNQYQFDSLENQTINVANLPNGMYFMQITANNYLVGKRFNVAK